MNQLLRAPSKNLRMLFFRFGADDYSSLNRGDLAWGLLVTWLVGMGRYWDHPSAKTLQYLGVGSVVYVFALAAFLYVIIWPLRVQQLSFVRLLTFITFCSLPAALYAIPVEKGMALEDARTVNFWFLAIVALWRVSLLIQYLHKVLKGRSLTLMMPVLLLPLTAIVTGLSLLNLEHAVFELMGGNNRPGTASDTAYGFVIGLSFLSWISLPFFLAWYVLAVIDARTSNTSDDPRQE